MSYVFLPDESASSSQQPQIEGIGLNWRIQMQGDEGAGSSCLMLRYANDTFSKSYMGPDGVVCKRKTVSVGGTTAQLHIWDTHHDKHKTTESNHYLGTRAVILNFDLTKQLSFDNAKKWLENKTNRDRYGTTIIVLSGNKSDLHSERVIHPDTVRDFIERWNATNERLQIKGYVETSAKVGTSVSKLFEVTANAIKDTLMPWSLENTEINSNTNESYKTLFHREHTAMREKEFFKFFRHTDIKGNEDLSEILAQAVKGDNRTRKVCVKLGWLNRDGSLSVGAPEPIRQNYPSPGSNSLENSVPKNKI